MNLESYTSKTVIPSRTRYQLRQFVINQHDTPQMRWRQILIEAQDLAYKIRMAELDCEQKKIEIHRHLSTGDPIDAIEAERKELGLILTERTLEGARMELAWLQELAEEVGSYSADEIEANQQEYWELRLNRQAGLDRMAIEQGISASNLSSMLNAGLINKQQEPCAISPTT